MERIKIHFDLPAAEIQKSKPDKSSSEIGEDILRENSKRERILRAARSLFAQNGVAATSTRDIAQKSQVNLALINYYFNNKEGLYLSVILSFAAEVEDEFRKLNLYWSKKTFSAADFPTQVRELISSIVALKFKNHELIVIFHREWLEGLPYARDIFETRFKSLLKNLSGFFAKAQSEKILKSGINPTFLTLSLLHTIENYLLAHACQTTMNQLCFELPKDMDLLVDQIYQIYFEGVTI